MAYEQAEAELRIPVTFTLVDILCDLDDLQDVAHQHGADYERSVGGEWVMELTSLEKQKADEFYKLYSREFEAAATQLKKAK